MIYLLDTNVISALRRTVRNPELARWIAALPPTDLYLSAVTVMEIQRGITRQRRKDAAYAAELARWLDLLISEFEDRIVPITSAIARRWGALSGALGRDDLDLAIAATALEHGMTVATRNVPDFVPAQVPAFDPFTAVLHTP